MKKVLLLLTLIPTLLQAQSSDSSKRNENQHRSCEIRCLSTIPTSTEPLIIVDNFPYEGPLENIKPSEVKSIAVLNGSAATSIWGVRAANGVILIELIKKDSLRAQPSSDATTSSLDSNTIVYFFQQNIQELLVKEITKTPGKRFFIRLSTQKDDKFELDLFGMDEETQDPFPKRTNRVVYVKKKFYPLVFDYDMSFATSDAAYDIVIKSSASENFLIGMSRTMYHWFFRIIFKRNGEVIEARNVF